ncbi:MAG: hypothetical protein AAFQ84_03160 [Pseudomonadota bacterium]
MSPLKSDTAPTPARIALNSSLPHVMNGQDLAAEIGAANDADTLQRLSLLVRRRKRRSRRSIG